MLPRNSMGLDGTILLFQKLSTIQILKKIKNVDEKLLIIVMRDTRDDLTLVVAWL